MMTIVLAVLSGAWQTTCAMAPYLLFGFLVAGLLSVLIPSSFVERHLGRGRFLPVAKAALVGIPLPLCSCGVIPVGAGLRRHGASKAATTAFLMSTPQTGVDSILVTYSLLGPLFAVFRPLAALFSGLFGGFMVSTFDGEEASDTKPCTESCCTDTGGSKLARALRFGLVTLPADIGKSLLVGLLMAGIIAAVLPDDFFARHLGSSTLLSMVVMMACGIPVYVCATASVPVAAALMAKGIPPGAALVFLMTGPATNAAAVSTIWQTMGRRTALLFLLSVALSALAAGGVLDMLAGSAGDLALPPPHDLLPGWVGPLSALTLLALIAAPVLQARRNSAADDCCAGHGADGRSTGGASAADDCCTHRHG